MDAADSLIVYIRLDDFFAAVEQQLVPALRQRPVVVGKDRVKACSREARQLGLRVGMPTLRVRRRCPAAVIVNGHRDVYAAIAATAWAAARTYTVGLESYDSEAYGDASGMHYLYGTPLALGHKLQQALTAAVELPVTIGLGRNRLLAWMAASLAGQGQVHWLRPYAEARTLQGLPLAELPGVSWQTRQQLQDMNLLHMGDLRGYSRDQLRALCGGDGDLLYERCRGLDGHTIDAEQRPESIHRSHALTQPQSDRTQLHAALQALVEAATRDARALGLSVGRCAVSIVYEDGRRATRQKKLAVPSAADQRVCDLATQLLDGLLSRRVAIRQLHLSVDRLSVAEGNGELFATAEPLAERGMYATIDRIRNRYGHGAILSGSRLDALPTSQAAGGAR